VIAPRVPHYALWSPGGDVLSYVAQSSYGLALFLSHADGIFVSDPIINGNPLFLAWCPDNNFLGVHAGEELSVIEVAGSRTTASVAQGAVGFRTPAFSDDGDVMAYAVPAEPGVAIMRAHFQGTGGREVHRFAGGVALAFRPGSRVLTVAVTHQPETGSFDELWSLDLGSDPSPVTPLARGPFVGYFWAPTGDRVALFIPAQTGDGRYAVQLIDHAGAPVAMSEAIIPSADYRLMLGFFDQYAQSHHVWSPDGRALLLSGRMAGDGVSSSFGDAVGDYVLLWPAERGAPLERVTPGEMAFFPPPPKPII
jgi:TolB protein